MNYYNKRLLFYAILFSPFIILALGIQAILRPFCPKFVRRLSHWTLSVVARYLFWATKTKVFVRGLENIPKNGCVFMANHQSIMDILLIYGYLRTPMAMIAKKALQHVIVVGAWMRDLGCYLIDTKNPTQAMQLFQKAAHIIKIDNCPLLIYPEGTRSRRAEMNPLRAGSMRLPLMAQCPIVPITLNGSWKLIYNPKRVRSQEVDIVIHPAIDTRLYDKTTQLQLMQKVEEAIKSGFTSKNQA